MEILYSYMKKLGPDYYKKHKIFNVHKKIRDSIKTTNEKFYKKGGTL